MTQNKFTKLKLEFLREFQQQHPTSHVGGSMGLFLRGIDLKRDLTYSDLDITIDEMNVEETLKYESRSDRNDFDFSLKYDFPKNYYIKFDIRINPEPSFEIVEFDGHIYNVSKLRDILFWKQKYSNKGVQKHTNDLITIATGIRPIEWIENSLTDDIPF